MEALSHLPVFREFDKIKEKWGSYAHFILKSPTGSGKSIALPYLLSSSGLVNGQILVVQPRRIAARMLARQVALHSGWSLGKEVGYQVRFEKSFCSDTKILYVTDGIAQAKLLGANDLDNVEVIILDEFHERSSQIDLCLALALRIWSENRPNLRIFVTSATLDTCALSKFLPQSLCLEFSDRSYPVAIEHYSPDPKKNVWQQVVGLLPKLLAEKQGDLLVFMDGAFSISKTIEAILSSAWSKGIEVYPLYGDLSPEMQDRVFSPSMQRKIIVSTNIAETSLTIPGIRLVVDTGWAKKLRFDSNRGINALLSEPVSRSSAEQRSGRAGRLGPGYCLRLWSKAEDQARPEYDDPEILRTDLSQIYLNLLGSGIKLETLRLLEELPAAAVERSKNGLKALGALSEEGDLTEHGRSMSNLPLQPVWSHALLEGKKRNIASAIALILAMIDERSPVEVEALAEFYPLRSPRSDVYCLLLAFEEAMRKDFEPQACRKMGIHARRCLEAEKVARSLCSMIGEEYKLQVPTYEDLARGLLRCLPHCIAHLVSEGRSIYLDQHGRKLHLNRLSVLRAERFVLPLKVVEKKIKGTAVLNMEWVNGVDEQWIREALEERIESSSEVLLDLSTRKVSRKNIEGWGCFILSSKETEEVSKEEKAFAYAKALNVGDLKMKKWDKKVEGFLARIRFLARKFPHLGLTELDEETRFLFFEQICLRCATWKEIRNLEVLDLLKDCYSKQGLKTLSDAAPEKIELGKNKRTLALDYSKGEEVVVRPILQDLYDVKVHPCIVYGEYPLVIEILAPNFRPVQRTSDLPGFWESAYPMIRKELAGRYPKHEWR